ncbi:hypothetical protein ALC53_02916 [Atta colombica]|uniref:Uncharacterized protein n=1 Tax=Atta colombica TaxID=520822 RepID=A0A195BQM0_9HYME|nr:hypothetical protein ALC53_02916 [Atta colombica]
MSEIRIRIVVLWYVTTYLTTRCLGAKGYNLSSKYLWDKQTIQIGEVRDTLEDENEFPELHSHCASLKTETSFCMQIDTIDTIYQTMSQYEIYIRDLIRTYRLENFEDNLEKKDGLARGLIAFVSCPSIHPSARFLKNGLSLSNSVFDNKYLKILASHQKHFQEIGTVVFELLRNECSHYPLRQKLRKTIIVEDLITPKRKCMSFGFVLGIGGLYLCLRGSAVASKELWALRG